MTGLYIPRIDPDADTLTAALAYAEAGWYVGYTDPSYHDPKSPEVMGKGWQSKTSRDPQTIVGWYAGRKQLGVFLHAGRSGAWVADVDHPELMPDVLAEACAWAPYQSTRPDTPGRGHYPFRQPPGRILGNSTGRLGKRWGEARGRNGVIVAWPTPHPDGGEYRWKRIGTVLELPGPVAELLNDTTPSEDAVTDDELTAFLTRHTDSSSPQLLKAVTGQFTAAVAEGESRHDAAVSTTCWAMREAAAGYYPARDAAVTLRDLYVEARGHDRDGGRSAVDEATARTEYRSILAWAIGQTAAADPDEVRAGVEQRTSGPDLNFTPPNSDDERGPFLDWQQLFTEDIPDEDWLHDRVFARGRGHAIYAHHKQGKSLFVLWCCAQLATTRTNVDVIYLDYEMTKADVRERLEDMGYGLDSDLSRLHYALLPSLPPLDTSEGMTAVLDLVDRVQRPGCEVFVAIDTTGRAVQGKENDADTYRDFYRWTGTALKRRGVTWARLDHSGKDPTKKQRGSSAKGDDVDIIWRLDKGDGGVTLHREDARMSWVPEKVAFTQPDAPLRYEAAAVMWPDGTKQLAAQLAKLGVPLDAGRPTARAALQTKGIPASNRVLTAAIKYRKLDPLTLEPRLGQPADSPQNPPADSSTDTPQKPPLTSGDSPADSNGQRTAVKGTVSVPLGTDSPHGPQQHLANAEEATRLEREFGHIECPVCGGVGIWGCHCPDDPTPNEVKP